MVSSEPSARARIARRAAPAADPPTRTSSHVCVSSAAGRQRMKWIGDRDGPVDPEADYRAGSSRARTGLAAGSAGRPGAAAAAGSCPGARGAGTENTRHVCEGVCIEGFYVNCASRWARSLCFTVMKPFFNESK